MSEKNCKVEVGENVKRFEFKLKVNFIDEETGEEIYHKVLIDNSNGNEIGFDDMVDLLNEQQATIQRLEKENQRVYGIIEDGGVLLTEKQLLDVIGEDKGDMFLREHKLYEENERLRNQLERKTILLKIRTKHIDDREKSFHELLNYLESFCYKSNIDGNYAKQDIINILNNWEIREYD